MNNNEIGAYRVGNYAYKQEPREFLKFLYCCSYVFHDLGDNLKWCWREERKFAISLIAFLTILWSLHLLKLSSSTFLFELPLFVDNITESASLILLFFGSTLSLCLAYQIYNEFNRTREKKTFYLYSRTNNGEGRIYVRSYDRAPEINQAERRVPRFSHEITGLDYFEIRK